jgi:Tfp pilus assembly protein PilV
MKLKTPTNSGFTALIAVILIALGVLALSLTSISSALLYADSVNQREYRIQARLHALACLDATTLMAAKNYFLNGTTTIPEFGCNISVVNDFSGDITLNVIAEFLNVTAINERKIHVSDNGSVVILQ